MSNHLKRKPAAEQDGFTLIETLVAMVILVIGIFGLYSMQTTAIRYNATASAITTSATWAADRIEQLLAVPYGDPQLVDGFPPNAPNGAVGLNDTIGVADGQAVSPDGRYTIFWNVAPYMTPNPAVPSYSTMMAIRIIVQHTDLNVNKQVVMNYYKQRTF